MTWRSGRGRGDPILGRWAPQAALGSVAQRLRNAGDQGFGAQAALCANTGMAGAGLPKSAFVKDAFLSVVR